MQSSLEGFRTHPLNQHLHNDRRLIIDDITVHQSGISQIIQSLLDRCSSICPVFCIRSRNISTHKIQAMINGRVSRFYNPDSEIVGKNFLRPYIIKPLHRHIIAKPHVGCFVGYQGTSPQLFIQRRFFIQEHALVII